jgi:hypothetical protein
MEPQLSAAPLCTRRVRRRDEEEKPDERKSRVASAVLGCYDLLAFQPGRKSKRPAASARGGCASAAGCAGTASCTSAPGGARPAGATRCRPTNATPAAAPTRTGTGWGAGDAAGNTAAGRPGPRRRSSDDAGTSPSGASAAPSATSGTDLGFELWGARRRPDAGPR